jgi:four helix bundle protein
VLIIKNGKMEKKNAILEKSFAFALLIIEYTEEMELQKKYVLSRQLLRSGTSIGANIYEAQSCESRADFIHKLKIADKEAKESEYWLLLCRQSKSYPWNEALLPMLEEIQRLLSSIIYTTKRKD